MFDYEWDAETHGILLKNDITRFVTQEVRPVFAKEIENAGMTDHFIYDPKETRPLMWCIRTNYYVDGNVVAQLKNATIGGDLTIEYSFEGKMELQPVDLELMILKNAELMGSLVNDTKRRVKELYDHDIEKYDGAYIAFSGGKDSVVLLDLCNDVLPQSVPVIYNDTGMEMPDSYIVWDMAKEIYPRREFIKTVSEFEAKETWRTMGPPSRGIRWCCAVNKSTPAILMLRDKYGKESIDVIAFVGVRGEESLRRSKYSDIGDRVKNNSQSNRMPILNWGSHEVWLYLFANPELPINPAYRKGVPRVGCTMCPESSPRYEWFVEKAYPGINDDYKRAIIETSSKEFKSKADENDYIAGMGWQARKSGNILSKFLVNPVEIQDGYSTMYKIAGCDKDSFFQWMKTIGDVIEGDGHYDLYPTNDYEPIRFEYVLGSSNLSKITFHFNDQKQQKGLGILLRVPMRKATACVVCRTCEAQCRHGAITFSGGKAHIDESKCVRCRECYIDGVGCWRFRSLYRTDTEKRKMSSINNYANFGLRENSNEAWISILMDMGSDFFPWTESHPLGNKKVDAARKWFIEANLITEKSKEPTELVEVFRTRGHDDSLAWDLVWMALVNRSVLMNWFVNNTDIDRTYAIDDLASVIKSSEPSLTDKTIDGGFQSLKDTSKSCPLGGPDGFIEPRFKGKKIIDAVTRHGHDTNPLTILYGLYMMAEITGRTSFRVSEMSESNPEDRVVSPIVAFGLDPVEFKRVCTGLRTSYPEYIDTTFTHGNDQVEVFTKDHTSMDVIRLVLGL